MKRPPIDSDQLRDRLAEAQGKRYWRSLEELGDDPAVRAMLEREFPDSASLWNDAPSRRRFLQLMGASLALAGLTSAGCRAPTGTIMPYVRQPENLVLGKPLFYATSMNLGGFATGLLVESHEGRPTKIEGNPQHPASLGATSPYHQAAVLGLYDPDRSQMVQYRGTPKPYADLLDDLRKRLASKEGEGVAILSETIGSPTLLGLREQLESCYPGLRWFTYEPLNRDNVHAGTRLAYGRPLHFYHDLTDADVIVSFDADFLAFGPAHLAMTRAFASRRATGGTANKAGLNRLYVFETDLSITGSKADHRMAVVPSRIDILTRALATALGVAGLEAGKLSDKETRWVDAIAKDLQAKKGRSVVLAGDGQPAAVHAVVHAINQALGNQGKTVRFTEHPLPAALSSSLTGLEQLTQAIRAKSIDTLLVLGGNPAYNTPMGSGIASLLESQLAKRSTKEWLAIHLGPYFDETARLCHWHIPEAHFLEQWGDGVAFDGTVSIAQPLIAPLYQGKAAIEVIASLTRGSQASTYDERTPHELVRDHWKTNRPGVGEANFERFWQKTLHEGVMAGTKLPTFPAPGPTLVPGFARELPPLPGASKDFEIVFAPDPAVYDGRFANNGWLQELPRPITRLTWDNALMMSPKTAKDLGVRNVVGTRKGGEHGETFADMVRVQVPEAQPLEVPAWIVPGHADGAVTLHLGQGRTHAGRVGTGHGFNAYRLHKQTAALFDTGVTVSKASGLSPFQMACVQAHHSMEGRSIVLSGTVAEQKNEHSPFSQTLAIARHEHHGHEPGSKEKEHKRHELPTLYPNDHPYEGYKWGMAVDLSACVGCSACVVACQSENNSPVIGKEEVTRGREMHWLRIDRYFETPTAAESFDELAVHFQPVMCQHCENAPCEVVCPVEATAHGEEGTNDMAYNRCVGTRYCANNCPYKVRRFNFLQYTDYETPSFKLMYNPDVTVRTRGVMEKCTFCIQRISYARIEAAKEFLDELDMEKATKQPKPASASRKDPNGRKDRRLDGSKTEIAYIRDGEVVTACQSACPAQAIVFGDLNDKNSKVHKLFESSLQYELLGELGVRPRVTYLAAIRNPNPALVEEVK